MDVLFGFMSHREVVSVKQLSGRMLPAHMAERCGCECFQIAADKTKSLIWGRRTLLDCDRQGKTECLLPISLWPGGHEPSLRRGRRDTQETGLTWRPEQPLHLRQALTLRSHWCFFVSFRSTWSPAEVNNLTSQTRPGVGERCRLPRFMVCYQRNGTVVYAALHLPSLFVHRPGFSI